ncbi:MAG TPA: hypothetical protein VHI13_22360 [Candidatus Kapabacteria bacterium]|nr:hypothetical protein [Candidatus Kapabacteria bacterium]
MHASIRHSLAAFLLVAFALTGVSVAQAKIDCTKIHVYHCPITSGGPYVKGDPGSVPGGATVTISDGHTATTTTAAADGSFSALLPNLVTPVGATITIRVGEESCTVTVEPCPRL